MAAEAAANAADAEADRLARLLPNLVLDGVPVGGEDDFVVLRHEGPAPRDFAAEGFEPQDHLAPRRGPGRDRHQARREVSAPASTTSRASAPASSWPS